MSESDWLRAMLDDKGPRRPSGNFNAQKCAEYLRYIGLDVSPETEAAWVQRQKEFRADNRRRNAELKRTCGHFRTYECKIYSMDGAEVVTACWDCHRYIARRPLHTAPPGRSA